MDNHTVSDDKRRGGLYISHSTGFVFLLLSVCLSVLVGLIVHLTSSGQIVCTCETSKAQISNISPEKLSEHCVELIQNGGSNICKACQDLATTPTTSSINTPPWMSMHTTSTVTTKKTTTSTTAIRQTTPKPHINYRLPESVRPVHYDLELQPEIYGNCSSAFTFNGSVMITINVTTTTRQIILHKKFLTVDDVSISMESNATFEVPVILSTNFDKVREFFIINLERDLQTGSRYKVELHFHGNMRTDGEGLFLTSYKDDNETVYLAATQFVAPDARSAFPCFDEPGMKATFNITLVRKLNTGRNYITLTNTDRLTTEVRGDYAADRFETTPVMSTYLLAVIVCDFDHLENITSNITYRTLARPNAIQYAERAHEYGLSLLDWFVEMFQPPYPLKKIDSIAIPQFVTVAMENWGLMTYRERILHQPGLITASQDSWTVEVISHEISHQWFGNIVTPKWWSWLWLKEGLASFWDFHAVEDIYPARRETEQQVVQLMHSVFETDSVSTSRPLTRDVQSHDDAEASFDNIVYRKGSSIVRMMHFVMGEELFIKGLNLYLTRHQYGNVDHYDLLNALTEESKQTSIEEGEHINMTYLMNPWIVQNNFPVVMVTIPETGIINVKQQRFLDNIGQSTSDDTSQYGYMWSIPITLATSWNTSNFNKVYTYRDIAWLHDKESNITDMTIPDPNSSDAWVMVNLHQIGYYRVNYEERNWKALIKHMEQSPYDFPPINRAQVINDAWALQKAGLVSMDIALQSLNILKNDTEYTAWRAFSREIAYLDRMLERSDLYGAFKAFMTTSITKSYLLHRMKVRKEDFPFIIFHTTRSSIYACKYGLTECREDALKLYRDWMKNGSNSVHPDLQSVALCNGVRYGGQEEWNFAFRQYWHSLLASIQEDAMDALTCTTEPWLLERILHMAVNGSQIRKSNARTIINRVAANPVGRDMAWNFVKSNFKYLHKQLGKSSLSSIVRTIATNFNTDYYIEELRTFNHASIASGYDSTFTRARATAQTNADWMKKNYDVIKSWLTEQ